jgi:hypothetical protein
MSKIMGLEVEGVGDQRASPTISKTTHFQRSEGGGRSWLVAVSRTLDRES